MKLFNSLPDAKDIERFLAKHNLSGYQSIQLIKETPKDINLHLDFGDGEEGDVTIRRRNGYNGNYRITLCSM